jgi:hypothetical protein
MKPLSITKALGVSSILVAALTTACATTKTDETATQCGSDYSCLSNMAFKYRQQAEHLTALAQRYELEAAAMTEQDATRQRQRAQAYWSEAREADELAQEYRRQLPHNMVH